MKHQFIDLAFWFLFIGFCVALMYFTNTLPQIKKFISRKIKAFSRLTRLRNFQRDAGRQVEANGRSVARRTQGLAAAKGVNY